MTTLAALLVTASAASALTISNKSSKEISVGLDMGDKESVHKIPAGKSAEFKSECKDGCGVTGPWAFSKLLVSGDKIETDGRALVVTE